MALNLTGKIELDGAGFERGLKRAGEQVTDLIKTTAVAAFGFYGVEQAIEKTVETATDLVNESKRLDLTVEQLQLLRQAAKDGGTEMGALASAFEKLDIARSKALAGDKDALAAFKSLGVGKDQLSTATAATIFTTSLSEAVKNRSVETIGSALKEILGKGFGELIPTLKTDFGELEGKLKSLGAIIDTDTAVKLKAAGDEFDLVKTIVTADLAPALVSLGEIIITIVGKIKSVAAYLGAGVSSMSFGDLKEFFANNFFGDAKSKSPFNSGAARQAYDTQEAENKKQIDEIHDKLKATADALKNPKPIITSPDPAKSPPTHIVHAATDSLAKVGNFLGSNGNVISRVEQQKISLLQQIVRNTTPKTGNSFGLFGLGIPLI